MCRAEREREITEEKENRAAVLAIAAVCTTHNKHAQHHEHTYQQHNTHKTHVDWCTFEPGDECKKQREKQQYAHCTILATQTKALITPYLLTRAPLREPEHNASKGVYAGTHSKSCTQCQWLEHWTLRFRSKLGSC